MEKTLLNKDVAESLGMSESGVSRIRTGSRQPSLSVMQKIESVYGWSVQHQSNAIKENDWPEKFEAALAATLKTA